MKKFFIIPFLLLSLSCFSQQKNNFAFSISMGTDFGTVLSSVGAEAGILTPDQGQGLFITLDANSLQNKSIYAYGRDIVANNNIYPSHASHEVGLKYYVKLFGIDDSHRVGVFVHPIYSMNLSILSVSSGFYTSYIKKNSQISFQAAYDPFGKRVIMKLVFTAIQL